MNPTKEEQELFDQECKRLDLYIQRCRSRVRSSSLVAFRNCQTLREGKGSRRTAQFDKPTLGSSVKKLEVTEKSAQKRCDDGGIPQRNVDPGTHGEGKGSKRTAQFDKPTLGSSVKKLEEKSAQKRCDDGGIPQRNVDPGTTAKETFTSPGFTRPNRRTRFEAECGKFDQYIRRCQSRNRAASLATLREKRIPVQVGKSLLDNHLCTPQKPRFAVYFPPSIGTQRVLSTVTPSKNNWNAIRTKFQAENIENEAETHKKPGETDHGLRSPDQTAELETRRMTALFGPF